MPSRFATRCSPSAASTTYTAGGPAEEATQPRRSGLHQGQAEQARPAARLLRRRRRLAQRREAKRADHDADPGVLMINALDAQPRRPVAGHLRRARPIDSAPIRQPTAWPSAGRLSPMSSTRLWRSCPTRDSTPAVRSVRQPLPRAAKCQRVSCTLIKERTIAQDYAGQKVAEILKRKKASVQQAPLPQGSPDWDTFTQMTWEQIEAGARAQAWFQSRSQAAEPIRDLDK